MRIGISETSQEKDIEKSSDLMPSMVFIGDSLNFGILEHSRI